MPISEPAALLEWARLADEGPFSTLGLLDRLVYDNPEPLVALALLAGATSRIRVQTEVLLAPLREPTLLAKQCATLDRLSAGRFTLGIGLGARRDDYEAVGVDVHRRGARLEEMMAVMRRVWSGEPYDAGIGPIGPQPARRGGPEVLFSAFSPAGIRRAARLGDGFLCAAHLADAESLFRSTETEWRAQGVSSGDKWPGRSGAIWPMMVPDRSADSSNEDVSGYGGGAPAPR
ncbi:LLM class flavin-dependent oxidoreductase [Nonomuraea sp. MTCD27]|uniref:LLM class flavin-dependent oxidoreductase n=1 Tax=Nonomuraea sp. MTCD27 TaxID=1676747 RepID=UPI0035C094B0